MTQPAPSPGVVVTRARSGSAWWNARAALAARRTRRFALRWSIALGIVAVLALLMPLLASDPGAADDARLERLAADTLRGAQRVRAARSMVASAESLLAAARATVREPARQAAIAPAPVRLPVHTDPIPADPDLAGFERLIKEARRARTVTAALALAADPAVSAGPRMRALADTLRALDARHATATAPGAAVMEPRIARTILTIIVIADNRRADLAAAGDATAPVPSPVAPAPVGIAPRETTAVASVDTLALLGTLAAARDTLMRVERSRDSVVAALRALDVGTAPVARVGLAKLSPALAALAVLLIGLAARFVVALRLELSAPTLADPAEAARMTGVRVMTTVREAPVEGPARFKPSGVDPFRMLYLSLTATGTRSRTAIIAGSDAEVTASIGARLAIAAAADHRNTLIVDLDPTQSALSRAFRERAEPGTSDVLAGAFTWREVARPVGSSDGLPITLLPAGTEREDRATGEQARALFAEFARLRAAYELTLAVAPVGEVGLALALIEASPILLAVVVGETSLDAFLAEVDALRAAGHKIHGLVLWDVGRPALPTRGELAAMLSKRKGRTPGGSFEAVRRAIGDGQRNINRP